MNPFQNNKDNAKITNHLILLSFFLVVNIFLEISPIILAINVALGVFMHLFMSFNLALDVAISNWA